MENNFKSNSIENYTLEKHLKKLCDNNYEYIDLSASWEIDKKAYEKMLQGISYNYPHYSMHDSSHSKSIISSIEMVLGRERIKLLGPTETWMILESAYLHDFGMILKNEYIEKIWETENFQDFLKNLSQGSDKSLRKAAECILNFKDLIKDELNTSWPIKLRRYTIEIISAYFRGKHPQMSKDYINNFDKEWNMDLTHNGLIKSRLRVLMGDIVFLHGQDFEGVMRLQYITNGLKTDYIHPRFIAEMIRLGDLLDLDNGRFNETIIKNFGKLPELSQYHVRKHGAINHVLINPRKIEISSNCSDDKEIRETRIWFDWLEQEVRNLTINWGSIVPENFSGCAPQISSLKILKNGKNISDKIGNLKLQIPRKRIFEILEGSGIYESKLDFLRELIQNALDASKIQMWRDLKSGVYDPWLNEKGEEICLKELTPFDIDEKIYDNYKIIVELAYTDEGKINIKVRDKGIGIDEKSLFNMANVGESWHKREGFKEELKDMPSWLKPTGGFGIGLQSCFMVTDEININTKTCSDNIGKNIKIQSGKEEGYITCEDIDKIEFNRGTEVEVNVDKEIDSTYSLGGYVSKKIAEYDSFIEMDEYDLWKIREFIYFKFKNPLFGINLIYQNKIQENYCSFIENYVEKFSNQQYDLKEGYLIKIDDKDFNKFYLWNKQYSILMNGEIVSVKNNRDVHEISFKGVEIEDSDIFLEKLINVHYDIQGISVEDILTLNRREIRKDKLETIRNIVIDMVKFMLKFYREKIQKENGFVNKVNTLSLKLLFDEYKQNSVEVNEKLIDNINEKIEVLKNIDNKYKLDKINAKKIFLEDEDKVILMDLSIKHNFEVNPGDVMNEIINNMNLITLNYKYVLIDEDLIEIIKENYFLYEVSRQVYYDNTNKYKDIYAFKLENYSCTVKIDEVIRKDLLKYLANKQCKRSGITCIEPYENLAIDTLPHEIYANKCYFWRNGYIKGARAYNIISPIIYDDSKSMKDQASKDRLKSQLKERPDFKKIVDYVFGNRAPGNNASKDEIVEDYMKLIDDYYEVVKDENTEISNE